MNITEFKRLAKERGMIMVRSRNSGSLYLVSTDQADGKSGENDLVYGSFVTKNPRRRGTYKWFRLRNVEVVDEQHHI